MQLCLNPDCRETQRKFWELSKKYDDLKKKTFSEVGWKGKDVIEIKKAGDVWTIVSHQKDKESGRVKEVSHDVPNSCILVMREGLFLNFIEHNEVVLKGKGKLARELKNWLVKKYNFNYSVEEFFGHRKEYFQKYYYPLVILNHFGLVEYSSNGNIVLTEHFFEQKNNGELVMWNQEGRK